jgi:hypothetical protein
LGNKKGIKGRRNLNPKKIAKKTNIRHKKILIVTRLDKGNILADDDHIINIEKKSLTMRTKVEKGEQTALDYEHLVKN